MMSTRWGYAYACGLGCLVAITLGTASVRADEPVRVQVAACEPIALLNNDGAPGVGNKPDRRRTQIWFGYVVDDLANAQAAIDATTVVEACILDKVGVTCPWSQSGDEDWLVYEAGPPAIGQPPSTRAPM